jgi:hypothetical protein
VRGRCAGHRRRVTHLADPAARELQQIAEPAVQRQAGADFEQQAGGRREAHRGREAPRPHGEARKRFRFGGRVAPAHDEAVGQRLRRGRGHAHLHAAGCGGVVAGDHPGAAALLLDHRQRIGDGRAAGKHLERQRMKMKGEPQHDNTLAGITSGNGLHHGKGSGHNA